MTTKTKDLPARSIKLEIEKNTYECSFPNTGQLIAIEKGKKRMSDGYDYELSTGSADSAYAKLLIDTVATFDVLLPLLKKDLNVESILDLSLIESRALVDVYLTSYLPWYDSWVGIINKVNKPEEEESVQA